MKKRYNRRFDQEISEIGFGAWQLGGTDTWGYMSKEDGIQLVREAVKNGVTFFDTAPGYGSGNSEKILGEALEGIREQVFINTKIGHGPNGEYEFNKEGIETSINRSLKNLKTTYLDSVVLHNPERYILEGKTDLFLKLERYKEKRLIRGFGVSIDSLEELSLVLNNLNVDTIEIMFNIIHQEIIELFDEISNQGILLIIKVPLDSGWLTGKYNEHSVFTGVRNRWSQEQIKVRSDIIAMIKDIVKTEELVIPALQFILHYNAVGTVIPGTKNIEQLHLNIMASDSILSDDIVKKLENLYDTTIKHLDTPW